MDKLELKSAPHRKVPVVDIVHNPHRDLKRNPIKEERVEELLESFRRNGFWDNIVVREHPTRSGKYELAYGHNRLAALKSKHVVVNTITIPVTKLTDYEMYCAMVDENETQGDITPAIVIENINKGCDLVEKAFKAVGREGTWEEFNEVMGRAVPRGTAREANDHGYEQARAAYFEGEGVGRAFLAPLLPGVGKMRKDNLSAVLSSRYGETRAASKTKKAGKKREEAANTSDINKKTALEKEATTLESEATRIGKGAVSEDILMMFDTPNMMTDFVAAIRKLGIPPGKHEQAAEHVIKANVRKERVQKELDLWWDQASGAVYRRQKQAERDAADEKFRKSAAGKDFNSYLLRIAEDLKKVIEPLKKVTQYVELADEHGRRIIRNEIAPVGDLIDALLERERESLKEIRDITPATTMLTHQKDG